MRAWSWLVMLLALAGCDLGGNATSTTNTGPAPTATPLPKHLATIVEAVQSVDQQGTPISQHGQYVYTQNVNVVDVQTGTLMWTLKNFGHDLQVIGHTILFIQPDASTTTPIPDTGSNLTLTPSSLVAVRAEDGKELWRSHLSGEVYSLAVHGTMAFVTASAFSTKTTSLHAINVADGKDVWAKPAQLHGVYYQSQMSASDSSLLISGQTLASPNLAEGPLCCSLGLVNSADGQIRWESMLTPNQFVRDVQWNSSGALALLQIASPSSMGSGSNLIEAVRAADGKVAWKSPSGSADMLLSHDGSLVYTMQIANEYTAKNSYTLKALDVTTGNVKWKNASTSVSDFGNDNYSVLSETDSAVFTLKNDGTGQIDAFNPGSGAALWSIKAAKQIQSEAWVTPDNHAMLTFGFNAQGAYALTAFDTTSGKTNWSQALDIPNNTTKTYIFPTLSLDTSRIYGVFAVDDENGAAKSIVRVLNVADGTILWSLSDQGQGASFTIQPIAP